jgi:hypothetical protein
MVKMSVLFWVVKPCGLVGRHQCFRETHCLHLQGSDDSTFLQNVGNHDESTPDQNPGEYKLTFISIKIFVCLCTLFIFTLLVNLRVVVISL